LLINEKERSIMTLEFLSQQITRRQLAFGAAGVAALTLLPVGSIAAFAQETTDLSTLGYPELDVTVTDSGFEGVPATTAAGRYLLKVTNSNSDQSGNVGAVAFLSPTPAGLSLDEFMVLLSNTGGGAPQATPMGGDASAAASPEGGDAGSGALPLEIYQMYFAGGAFAPPGQSVEAVIDLKPGDYIVWADDPEVPLSPVMLTVTGDMPQDLQDPEADVTVTLIDFAIMIEGTPTTGKHLWKIQHEGAQPHFLDLEKGPDTMTKEQVQAALMADESATPTPGGLDPNTLEGTFYSPTQSIGTVTYQWVDLTEGTYLAACFFPTAGTGIPHAMNGMIDVFTVGASGSPEATPST